MGISWNLLVILQRKNDTIKKYAVKDCMWLVLGKTKPIFDLLKHIYSSDSNGFNVLLLLFFYFLYTAILEMVVQFK